MGPFHLSPSRSVFALYRGATSAIHEQLCPKLENVAACRETTDSLGRRKLTYRKHTVFSGDPELARHQKGAKSCEDGK